MPPKGSLCLVLHGHLPFIRHPEMPECLEEDWYFEALTEVYLPLLDVFDRLRSEQIPFKIAFSLSPTLVSMFQDPLLSERTDRHMDNLIRLAESECRRTASSPEFGPLAVMYRDRFVKIRHLWNDIFHRDLIGAFRDFQRTGQVELLTTAATHGFLPLMQVSPAAVRAQIKTGCDSFERALGFRPSGFWLPECAYAPGLDLFLRQEGIRYTFLESHGFENAAPRPRAGVYGPVLAQSGVVFFGRDPETARQVWSSVEGYPGDEWYRDFYRDIGFDLDQEYLKPFLTHGNLRVSTGMKYYRITGKTDNKQPYQRTKALEKVREHAGNFFFNRERQTEFLHQKLGQPPVIVAMYDAELFGHWWFEGPDWLEALFRKFHSSSTGVKLETPSEVLEGNSVLPEAAFHLSTWGWRGYNEMWLQEANAWIYRHLHRAAWRMEELASGGDNDQLARRALNQAARELFLAQASDWAFILAQGTACGYAHMRLERHINRFTRLYEQIKENRVNDQWLSTIETQDNIFPSLDYRIYQ